MHAKQKGNCGELAVALDLARKGYAVFTELGDLSKTDLITLVEGKAIKIQVKARNLDKRTNTLPVSTKKDGPNYSYKYTLFDVDIFAILSLDTGDIVYIAAKELLKFSSCMSFRFDDKVYEKDSRAHYIKDYLSFEEAVKIHCGPVA